MSNIKLVSALGLTILATASLLAAFLGWRFGPRSGVDQPIIISDGSMYIERKDGVSFKTWTNETQPTNLYPTQPWQGLDVTDDGHNMLSCSSTDTQCTIDIKYDRDAASIHVKYRKGDSHPLTITSDNDTFDTWTGYKDHLMYHPKLGKIKSVNGKDASGDIQVVIHHIVQIP